MDITPYYSDDSPDTDATQSVTGTTNVLNRSNSIFGAGWNLDGLDQLVFDPTGHNITYVRSDGTMGYFTSSDGLTYSPPAGPFAFLTLSGDGDGDYFLNDPSTGTTEQFNSAGALVSITDHDGNVTSYTQTTGVGFKVTDPAGRVTYYDENDTSQIGQIEDFAGRYTYLSYSGSQLVEVDLPDPDDGETPAVYTFGYDASSGMMDSYEDADGNTTQYVYRTDDTLEKAINPDGSEVVYQAAMSPIDRGTAASGWFGSSPSLSVPLVYTSGAVGVQTDESGNPTVFTFDKFGDPTSVRKRIGRFDDLRPRRQWLGNGNDPADCGQRNVQRSRRRPNTPTPTGSCILWNRPMARRRPGTTPATRPTAAHTAW